MTCALLHAVSAVAAIADELRSSHNTFTATVRNLALLTGGATDTVSVRLNQENSDGDNQCNVDAGETLTIKAVSSNASAATVKWADNNSDTISFVGCQGNDARNLTVTSGSAGSANVTFSIVTNSTGSGTYDLMSRAPFTVTVTPPPNTPPQVEVTGVADGAFYEKGSVPTAGCTVVDAEDSNESASPVVDSSALNSYGLGLETVTCSYTDQGGLNTTARATYSIVDTTKPVIAPHADVSSHATSPSGAVVNDPPPTASDAVYGDLGDANCVPAPGSTFPLGDTTVTCTATDGSGNTTTSTFKVTVSDATPPVITHDIQGTLGNNDWYTGDVDLTWSVTDPESPNSISKTGCADQHITSDQGPTTYSCSATSSGGNAGPETVTIKRDGTPPDVTLGAVSGTAGTNDWYKSAVTQTFNASDATSGLADPNQDPSFTKSSGTNEEGQNVNIPSGPVSDNAGNTASASAGPFKIDLSNPEANCDSAPTGWSRDDVNVHCQASDAVSGLADNADGDFDLSTSVPNGTETANASTGNRVVADAAGRTVTAGPISGIKVDKKAPVLTDDGPTPANPNGANNWYTSAVTNKFTATDGGSGFGTNGDPTKTITNSSGPNEGNAVKIASGPVSDAVGNSAASIDSAAFKIDLSDPTNVTFVGGPAANGSYDFSDTPAKPTCAANDAVSGVASCDVTGYSTAVGTHTMTATAKDNAGRTATATRQYTVKAWTFKGFYQPVDMNDTVNTVKSGSTVPIKFELLKGTTELTDTANVVQPLKAQKISCTTLTGDPEDLIEMTVTGGTSLRYDTTGGQFIYNWKTPTGAGTCYNVTISSLDGSSQTAYFKLK
jgi:hypothetical protein